MWRAGVGHTAEEAGHAREFAIGLWAPCSSGPESPFHTLPRLHSQLVGQRWAQLSSEERQHYVDMAARVRKSMRASQAEEEEEAVAKRACSDTAHLADAGTERPQRTLRPPSRYTSADLGAC